MGPPRTPSHRIQTQGRSAASSWDCRRSPRIALSWKRRALLAAKPSSCSTLVHQNSTSTLCGCSLILPAQSVLVDTARLEIDTDDICSADEGVIVTLQLNGIHAQPFSAAFATPSLHRRREVALRASPLGLLQEEGGEDVTDDEDSGDVPLLLPSDSVSQQGSR